MASPQVFVQRTKTITAMQTALNLESIAAKDREETNRSVARWMSNNGGSVIDSSANGVSIESPDGNYLVGNGWWILQDENALFYPMDPMVFQQRYVSINEGSPEQTPDIPDDSTDPETDPETGEEPSDGTDPTTDPEADPDATA